MFAGRSVEAISYDRYLRIPAHWSSTDCVEKLGFLRRPQFERP